MDSSFANYQSLSLPRSTAYLLKMDDQTLEVTEAGAGYSPPTLEEDAIPDASAKSKRSKLRTALRISKYTAVSVCAIIGLQFLIFVVYIAVLLMFIPLPPIVRIYSLSASDFNISGNGVVSAWAASFAIQNPNLLRAFNLSVVEAPMTYRKDLVSTGSAVQIDVVSNEEVRFAVTFRLAQWKLGEKAVDGMRRDRDRERGRMEFDVAMAMQGELLVAGYFRRPMIMNALCLRLNVTVNDSTGAGIWMDSSPKDCIVLM